MLRVREVLHCGVERGRGTVTQAIIMHSRQAVTLQTRVDEGKRAGRGRDRLKRMFTRPFGLRDTLSQQPYPLQWARCIQGPRGDRSMRC